MPSDARMAAAQAALAPRRDAYASALARAVEEVRAWLHAHSGATVDAAATAGAGLGAFATDRIDAARFAAVFAEAAGGLDTVEWMEAAAETLSELVEQGDSLFHASVSPDGDAAGTIRAALASTGRAFAAARAAARARRGLPVGDGRLLVRGLPPADWNAAERTVAPPLVVELPGAALRVDGLADLLVGAQAVVLVADGPTSPAALVRLVTPGVLVLQTSDPAELSVLKEWDGPAVAALVPEGAARFLHHPGRSPALVVTDAPAPDAARTAPGRPGFVQLEELRLLAAAAQGPGAATTVGTAAGLDGAASPGAAEPPSTADRLAAWLLRQADLEGGSGA